MTSQTLAPVVAAWRTEVAALALAALTGVALIAVAGFAHGAVLHEAAHDQRHSVAFPCH